MQQDVGLGNATQEEDRDFFAAAAMNAIISNIASAKTSDGEYLRNVDDVADLAYKQADAMLKARKQPNSTRDREE